MSGPSINEKDSLHSLQKTYTRLTQLEETSHCNTVGRKLSVRWASHISYDPWTGNVVERFAS